MRSDSTAAERTDVLVIGGGPAGSVAAGLLARKGYDVTLCARGGGRHDLAESLPPSCLRLFDRMGLAGAVERAGFLRSRGNTVWWGSDEEREELFPGEETGLQVQRQQLEAVLQSLAEQTGVRLCRPGVVSAVTPDGDAGNRAEVRDPRGEVVLHARWIVDASGRAGVVGRRVRRPEPGRETVALVGVWRRRGGWTLRDPSHTLVESYEDGWVWSVPVDATTRYVTVMVDRGATDLDHERGLSAMYHGQLRKTSRLGPLVEGADEMDLWACSASPYHSETYVVDRCLLVGDAGSFIDPLSSYGVKKALASAWVAAAVVHTALTNPEMRESALAFHDDREREVYRRFRELTARQYREAGADHPFWVHRAAADPADLTTTGEPDIDALRADPAVLSAFADLRAAPGIDLTVGTDVDRVQGPAIQIDQIVLEDRIRCPRFPEGLRYLRGVDVVRLVDLAPQTTQVPDLFEVYNRELPPVPLPDFLGALSVLIAVGILEHRAAGPRVD